MAAVARGKNISRVVKTSEAETETMAALARDLWTSKRTWEELLADRTAFNSFLLARDDALATNFKRLDWSAIIENIEPKIRDGKCLMGTLHIQDDKVVTRGSILERTDTIIKSLDAFAPGSLIYTLTPTSCFDERGAVPTFFDLYVCINLCLNFGISHVVLISSHGIFVMRPSDALMKAAKAKPNAPELRMFIEKHLHSAASKYLHERKPEIYYSQIMQLYETIGFNIAHIESPNFFKAMHERKNISDASTEKFVEYINSRWAKQGVKK